MTWSDAIDDRWGGRSGTVRLIVRAVGNTFFGYLLYQEGAFSGPVWIAVGTGVAVAMSFVLLVLRTIRSYDRWALALTVLLMVVAIVLNPWITYLGSVYFVIGGIMLVGQPEVPIRLGVVVTTILGLGLMGSSLVTGLHWSVILGNVFGVAAVVLFGANRRQRILRLQQEEALALRSQELEERNAELVAQTERTRQEAARVAALEERGRIARDLHDLLAHSLGGLVVQLEAAGAELERGRLQQAAARVATSRRLAVDGLREARAAVQELRTDADAAGPADLVDQLRAVVRGPVGVHLGIDLETAGAPRPVPSAVAEALAAVAREGLTNINKHARDTRGSATVIFEPGTVRLELVNGITDRSETGTDTRALDELAGTGGGAGLPGLRSRMAAVGGTLRAGAEGRRWVLEATCPVGNEPQVGEPGVGRASSARPHPALAPEPR